MFSSELPEPILLHSLKHHVGFIRSYILKNTHSSLVAINSDLRTIGSSQLDLYYGPLLPEQIAHEVIIYLSENNLLHSDSFELFVKSVDRDYQCLKLSDGTDWVLRWGIIKGRYVHLHPARYAAYTIRVKAASLKTAIAIALAVCKHQTIDVDKEFVNKIRREWLGLTPIKTWNTEVGAGKLLKLIMELIDRGNTTP
jgi:hypothetical protein